MSSVGRPRTPAVDLLTTTRRYITLQQLAEYMDIARRTLYYHVEKGALPVVRRRGVLRIKIDDAREYADISVQAFQPHTRQS